VSGRKLNDVSFRPKGEIFKFNVISVTRFLIRQGGFGMTILVTFRSGTNYLLMIIFKF